MAVFCTKCGASNEDYAQACAQCQAPLPQIGGYQPIQPPSPMYGTGQMQDWKQMGADKKLTAGICGILVGGFGIHKFILGYTSEGVIQIVLTFITCGIGSIIGLVEGIIYLTKSDEDFVRTYIQNKRGWF
jgi:TM2 domain-containing membrane protein YozV